MEPLAAQIATWGIVERLWRLVAAPSGLRLPAKAPISADGAKCGEIGLNPPVSGLPTGSLIRGRCENGGRIGQEGGLTPAKS